MNQLLSFTFDGFKEEGGRVFAAVSFVAQEKLPPNIDPTTGNPKSAPSRVPQRLGGGSLLLPLSTLQTPISMDPAFEKQFSRMLRLWRALY